MTLFRFSLTPGGSPMTLFNSSLALGVSPMTLFRSPLMGRSFDKVLDQSAYYL